MLRITFFYQISVFLSLGSPGPTFIGGNPKAHSIGYRLPFFNSPDMIELISDKEIKKANEELIELHKRVLLNYLIQKDISNRTRKKFFILYNRYIKTSNIRQYFHVPIRAFVYCLVIDELERVTSFKSFSKVKLKKLKGVKIKTF